MPCSSKRKEVSAAAQRSQILAVIFARWLPVAQRVNEGTSTETEEAEDRALMAQMSELPAVDTMDVWRKVAMAFDVTDRYHTGHAATLRHEARAALGITTATCH